MKQHLISMVLFLPAVFGATICMTDGENGRLHKALATIGALLTLGFSLFGLLDFDSSETGFQLIDKHQWISAFNIDYIVGVDGFGIMMVILTALLFLVSIIASIPKTTNGSKGFYILILLLETTVLGIFCSLDLFLLVSFLLASIVPIYFLVAIWGSGENENASNRFFLYQLMGGVLVVVSIISVYYLGGSRNLNLVEISGGKFSGHRFELGDRTWSIENIVYIVLLAGFAVRAALVPFHSWLPKILAAAPAHLSSLIVGSFLSTGVYSILRINYQLFPGAAVWTSKVIAIISVANIIYGAMCAIAQTDIRGVGGYGVIAYTGFILLGASIHSKTALHGAVLSLVSQGLLFGLFFLLVDILGIRNGEFKILDQNQKPTFGGLVHSAPTLTAFFSIAIFAILGIPGLGGFTGQSLVFLGSFSVYRNITIMAIFGMFLCSTYLLWMYRHVFLGKARVSDSSKDMTTREQMYLLPLVFLTLLMGVYPSPFIRISQGSVDRIVSILQQR